VGALTLALDASTYEGSVALLRERRVIAERTVAMRGELEERLMPAVADVFGSADTSPRELARIVCGGGPGSFTSLRIAGAIAKGLATAARVPLYEVSSLALAAVEAGQGRWVVTLDAMRGECFVAGFDWDGTELTALSQATIVASADIERFASDLAATSVVARPHARAVAAILDAVAAEGAVELATWEPSYGRRAEAQVRWEAIHGRGLPG
jgi:tRNA threonylcarbamoyladenosine biosynthesis protein TsaB